MAVEVKVPSAGESVTEAILARWLKKDGDYVKADEPVVEMETDKASQEIPAPAAGTLRTSVAEGTTVAVGSVIGWIEEGATAPAEKEKPPAGAEREEKKPPKSEAAPRAPAAHAPGPKKHEAKLSPSARVH